MIFSFVQGNWFNKFFNNWRICKSMKISPCFTHHQGILGVYDFLLSGKSNRSYIKNDPCSSKLYNGTGGGAIIKFLDEKYAYLKRNKHFSLTSDICLTWKPAPLRYASLASLFTGAKEAKFPYFSKGKPVSSWLISNSSDISFYKSLFYASNSWLAFCFALLRVRHESPAHALHLRPTSSAGTTSVYDS